MEGIFNDGENSIFEPDCCDCDESQENGKSSEGLIFKDGVEDSFEDGKRVVRHGGTLTKNIVLDFQSRKMYYKGSNSGVMQFDGVLLVVDGDIGVTFINDDGSMVNIKYNSGTRNLDLTRNTDCD